MRVAVALVVALLAAGTAAAAFTARTQNPASSLATAASFECDYAGLVLGTAGVASYWRLGETSGTTAADSSGAVDGTYTGAHTLGVSGGIAGDTNAALRLAGGYADMADNHDFAGTASFSLEAWVRPTTIDGTSRRIVSKALGGLQGYEFSVNSGSGLAFQRIAGSTNTVTAAAPPLNSWSHVVATYDGTTMRLYVNGSLSNSAASALSLLDNAAALRLGNSALGTDGWAGDLDDIAIYAGALSAAQVQNHFRCGHRYRDVVLGTAGLQSYWRLGESSGTTAFDSKGTANGAHANGPTLGGVGAPTYANDATIFDGVDDYIDFGDVHDFAGTASFTVEGWINRGTLGEADKYRWIATKMSVVDPRDGWAVSVAPDILGPPSAQRIMFNRIVAGTEHIVLSTTATVAGTWYHFAATYDGTTMRMYLNGALEASTASALSLPNTTFPMRMSSAAPPSVHRFPGRLDEIAVYNVALTAAQVAEHYRAR
jgi:hypothetical protein